MDWRLCTLGSFQIKRSAAGAAELMRASDGTASVLRVRTEATKGPHVVARETAPPDTT